MSEPTTQLETVNVHVADGAATIELNRPQALNAWNAQFGADLLAALGARRRGRGRRARRRDPGAGRALLLRRRPEGHQRRDDPRGRPDVTRR